MRGIVKQERVAWIDISKAIGILLVVLGHMNIPVVLSKLIFSFHMPLFFYISGFLFNAKKYSDHVNILFTSRAKSLLWPFFTFTLLSIIIILRTDKNFLYNFNFIDFLRGNKSPNTPLWFLTALFSVEIIFVLLIKLTANRFKLFLLVLLLFGLGIYNAYVFKFNFILNLTIALVALFYFWLGWFSKSININNFSVNKYTVVWIILLAASLIILANSNSRLDMYSFNYGYLPITIVSSILGICLTLIVSKVFLKSNLIAKIMSFIGRNTLTILGVHTIIPPLVVSFFTDIHYRLDRLLSILLIVFCVFIFKYKFPKFLSLR